MQDQVPDLTRQIGRRGFLEAGAGALAIAAAIGERPAAAQDAPKATGSVVLPSASWARAASTSRC